MSSPSTIEAVLRSLESGEYFSRLVHQPTPHRLRQPPELVYHRRLNDVEPRLTVVTPTFNHEPIIRNYVDATAGVASLPFDWILVDDGSEDGTAERVKAIFESMSHPLVARATVVRYRVPVFETACDNLGFALAETDMIIEIQSDIQIREAAYDKLLLRALSTEPRPSSVSGRCGHTFMHLRRSSLGRRLFERPTDLVGLCGRTIDAPDSINPLKGRMYRCETVNRGPWALWKRDLERHGYLDEKFFFLGNDDHDYHRRLFEAEGRKPLYLPLSLYSPLQLGASRRSRSGVNQQVFETLKNEKKGSPEFHAFLKSLRSSTPPESIEF